MRSLGHSGRFARHVLPLELVTHTQRARTVDTARPSPFPPFLLKLGNLLPLGVWMRAKNPMYLAKMPPCVAQSFCRFANKENCAAKTVKNFFLVCHGHGSIETLGQHAHSLDDANRSQWGSED